MAAPDAQYAIEIAAAMPSGEHTIAQLDELTAKLTGGGKNAEHFQQAIVQVSSALDEARAANQAASAALATGSEEYRRLERAALQAAKAAERAAAKNGGVVPFDLAARAADADMALDHYVDTLRALEREATNASDAEAELARTLANLRKVSAHVDRSFAAQAEQLSKLQGALSALGGPLGRLGVAVAVPVKGFSELSASIGKSRAVTLFAVVGIAALAAAVVTLTAAFVAGTLAIATWGMRLADSARSAGLAREALEALHPELALVRDDIAGLVDDTGLAEDALRGLARNLLGAKVSAEDLPAALRAAALAEAALGTGGSADFIAQIKEGKLTVDEFARNAEDKFGGIVARQMLGLEAQGARLRRNFSELFSGLQIDSAIAGMQILSGIFDETGVTGQTIKFLFESIFQPLIDQAENAAYAVEAFAIGFLIGMLKMYLGIKPAIKGIMEFFGFEDTSLEGQLRAVTKAGEIAAYVFAFMLAGVVALAAGVGLLVVGAASLVAIFVGPLYAAVYGVIKVFGILGDAVGKAWDYFKSTDLSQIGIDMLKGLARGILGGGADAVMGAVQNVVSAAIRKAKSLLGIASPSKVFREFGDDTGEGFALGVEDAAPRAQDALADMVEPPEVPASALSMQGPAPASTPAPASGVRASPGTGGSAGASLNLAGANFNFYGVKDAENARDLFEEALTALLEGDAAKLGAASAEGDAA